MNLLEFLGELLRIGDEHLLQGLNYLLYMYMYMYILCHYYLTFSVRLWRPDLIGPNDQDKLTGSALQGWAELNCGLIDPSHAGLAAPQGCDCDADW